MDSPIREMDSFPDQNNMSLSALPKRPMLVWVICGLFVFGFLGSLYYFLIKIPLIISGSIPNHNGLREYLTEHVVSFYLFGVITLIANISGVTYLFLLRRPALYFLGGAFILHIVHIIFQISCGFPTPRGAHGMAIFIIASIVWNSLNIPVLAYVGYLYCKQILR